MATMLKTSGSQKARKKKATESTQKEKKSQRGMGVAKLEAQRLQTESTRFVHQPINQYYVPCSYPSYGSVGPLGLHQRGLGLVGPICGSNPRGGYFGYFTGEDYGFGAPGLGPKFGEVSRELASIPNVNQFSENLGYSNKKKRVNGESLGCNEMKGFGGIESQINGCGIFGFNLENNQFIGGRTEEIRVKSPSLASYVGGNMDQDREVVAVHMKGDSSVLMEYEFFPGYKNGYRDTFHKNNTNPKDDDYTSPLSLTTTTTASTSTTTSMGSNIYTPKPIDLSLKLSY